jgi:hypothetical protein
LFFLSTYKAACSVFLSTYKAACSVLDWTSSSSKLCLFSLSTFSMVI